MLAIPALQSYRGHGPLLQEDSTRRQIGTKIPI